MKDKLNLKPKTILHIIKITLHNQNLKIGRELLKNVFLNYYKKLRNWIL